MTRDEYEKLDILERLKFWVSLPQGETLDPSWNEATSAFGWDFYIREVCLHAVDHIERLRGEIAEMRKPASEGQPSGADRIASPDYVAGRVTIDPADSFEDIKKKLHPWWR